MMTEKNSPIIPVLDWANPVYAPFILRRANMLEAARTDHTGETLAAMLNHYAKDPVAFIQDWMVTYDPRRDGSKTIPFILFPRQQDYILWLEKRRQNKEDGVCEKSRDMGVTWLTMAYALWAFIFIPGFKGSFGSRKEALVDRVGDNDGIFEKGRMIMRNMPIEFIPEGFDLDKHMPFMKFINPENGSTITGEAGDNIGRGGRSSMYFKDESAFYERPERIEAALSENSDVKIDISTPNGMGNPFAQKRHSGEFSVFTFHWRDHPLKDIEWYRKKKKTTLPHIFAQEIEIDYHASVEDICIPVEYVEAAIGFDGAARGISRGGFDPSDEGKDSNGLILADGCIVEDIQEWNGTNITQNTRKAWQQLLEYKASIVSYDSIGLGLGAKGEFISLKDTNSYQLQLNAVNVGLPPTKGYFGDRPFRELFANKKAELWMLLRMRFERTWEQVNGIAEHNPEDLISLPKGHPLVDKLKMELCSVKTVANETGKLAIEGKKSLRRRGLNSPNLADACVILFARPPLVGFTKAETSDKMDRKVANASAASNNVEW